MSLKDRIAADLKVAMKAKDQVRLDTLRSVLSAFSYGKIEAGADLGDDDQLEVVKKLAKQRSDSIEAFKKGGRAELVAKETREREILLTYLPARKTADDIRPAVRAQLESLPAAERTMAGAMKAVMPALKDDTDGNTIRQVVTEELKALGG